MLGRNRSFVQTGLKREACSLEPSHNTDALRIQHNRYGSRLGILFTPQFRMEKIKNGDPVIYKEQMGTIYGKPRESKYRGTTYTVKVGDDYYKAAPGELKMANEELGKPLTHF